MSVLDVVLSVVIVIFVLELHEGVQVTINEAKYQVKISSIETEKKEKK